MTSSADMRRLNVLRAIVADYVASHEPVGSKALVERHNLGVSSATIRNDMAVLEEQQLIAQPHTSSGRIPTDKGYRHFVDGIATIKPLSRGERAAILRFYEGVIDLDDVLRRSARLLSQLTNQVALVQYPTLSTSTVRHVEVVSLSPSRLLLVVILDSGRVDQRLVDLPPAATPKSPGGASLPLSPEALGRLRQEFNEALAGKRLSVAAVAVAELPARVPEDIRAVMQRCATVALESLVEHPEERLAVGGAANLTRSAAELPDSARSLIEALEEQVTMLKLLQSAQELPGVTVQFGSETTAEEMTGASIVSSSYGSSAEPWGAVAVLGPTRMDYPGTMARVAAVARYIGEILEGR